MLKIIKYLKPFTISIVLVLGLLFIQAISDLSLPDYTSNIVNVGIQQGGIENAVPKIIRKSELDKLNFFINEDDQKQVEENYVLLDKASLSQSELERYLEDYPLLDQEPLYMLNTKDKQAMDMLNKILGKPILIISGIEKEGMVGNNSDPFAAISKMPEEQMKAMTEKINEKFQNMPESMITQSAVVFIHKEYQIIGVDTNELQTNYIMMIGFKMLLIALVSAVASVIVGLLAARVAAGHSKNLRNVVFKRVTDFSNSEFDKFSTASLITRSTNDIQQIQMLMVMLLRIVFYAPILGIGGMIKVLNTNTSMGWIIAVAVGAILALVVVLFGVAIPKFKSIQKLIDRLNLVTRESLIGMLVIRAFNNEEYEEKKFDQANQDLTQTSLFVNRLMSMMMPMMMLIMNGITLLIVWVGAHQIDSGRMQVGDMMAFIQYTMQIIMAFLMISMVSIMFPRASVSAQRLAEVLDTEITISDLQEPKKFAADIKGLIEFKNVSFRYPGAEEDVLSNISFTAKPGEITAFIGSTGSGKTTLVNLIPRFYDVTEGEILIDGMDIRDVSQHELRNKIGYVPQKGVLFSGTIESNIKYADKNASKEELEKAVEIAQVAEFIRSTPEGFSTEISQGGTNVSGGQKQRLSIARALIKKPEIYIFDDSFSALDFKTDAALRKALSAETVGSTVLIVGQRISTIMNANKIIVLDEGKIAGYGSHQELMKTCEVYQQIALSQLSKEELTS
ncbi:ATP-binding cassette subfamily B protein [Anaerosolibacter carboniphilus]|uniref:ATP-binding cassette subfamily B protein n=1 Tax=Anaerosolibacter carboniphilus TaxID=1417629 RepID=A0A841KVM1_9FIRM|nr:ABC transporter ATP-binding protein [Anaerosolibacter carboniphilus]MBB6214235.1 ATP-binding cassette subfamily B protein [Anaerosolibacter carboniphilus]